VSIEKLQNTGKIARQGRRAHRQAVRAELKARVAKDRSNARDYYAAEKAGRWGSVGATFLPAVIVLMFDPIGHALLFSIAMTPPLLMASHTALYFDKSTYLYRLKRGEVRSETAEVEAIEPGLS